jgi:hypothetical protein
MLIVKIVVQIPQLAMKGAVLATAVEAVLVRALVDFRRAIMEAVMSVVIAGVVRPPPQASMAVQAKGRPPVKTSCSLFSSLCTERLRARDLKAPLCEIVPAPWMQAVAGRRSAPR